MPGIGAEVVGGSFCPLDGHVNSLRTFRAFHKGLALFGADYRPDPYIEEEYKRARDHNKKANIIVRCYLDEFTEILESLGANEVISSSKSAFNEIATHVGAVAAQS